MNFRKPKQLIEYVKRKTENDFIALFIFMIFIGVIRNLLEMIGLFTKSINYSAYYPTLSSFFDTISYVFLIIIVELYIVNLLFRGTKKQLRLLVQKCVWLLLGLFILIPVLNNIFNYHFFHLPISYSLGFIHPYLSNSLPYMAMHYGPVGISTAFIIVMLGFPFWLKRFYNSSLLESFTKVWVFNIVHYIITYQIMINFSWESFSEYNLLLNVLTPLNAYTFWFLAITLLVYPFFIRDYPINKKGVRQTRFVYCILWIMLGSLFFIGGPY